MGLRYCPEVMVLADSATGTIVAVNKAFERKVPEPGVGEAISLCVPQLTSTSFWPYER